MQTLVDWLTQLIIRFSQWLASIHLPFGLDPIWMFSGILVFGGVLFPFVAALFYMSWKEQTRSSLLTKMQQDLSCWREPVCSLLQTNTILYSLNAMDGANLKNIINAYLLRMIYDGRLKPKNDCLEVCSTPPTSPPSYFPSPREEGLGVGSFTPHSDDASAEAALFSILKEAAGKDRTFQPQELTLYMNQHRQEMKTFVLRFRNRMTLSQLKAEKDTVRKVLGFKKFLEEFTISNERHAYEVQLWRDYLIYATLFGCGEQVRKDMHQLNPDFFKFDARIANINLNFELGDLESDLFHYSSKLGSICKCAL